MSYIANIICTKFTEVFGEKKETWGVKVFDDFGQTYEDGFETMPYEGVDILEVLMDSDNHMVVTIIHNLFTLNSGVWVDGEHLQWDEIKHLWKK